MKSWMLVGHRGVGKSSLLKKIAMHPAFQSFSFLSLDEWIEQKQGESIFSIFSNKGEGAFREIEKASLLEIARQEKSVIIDVGAGYLGEKPGSMKALWVKRKTHPKDYGFMNRPLLDDQFYLSDERFQKRESHYRHLSDHILEWSEGDYPLNKREWSFLESLFLGKDFLYEDLNSWILTQTPDVKTEDRELLQRSGLGRFEYRDDQTSIPDEEESSKKLISFRVSKPIKPPGQALWDWPLEWGFNQEAPLLSLHKKQGSVKDTLSSLPKTDQFLKLALPVDNFDELIVGHHWRMEDPKKRSFLPMSQEGRWAWYRLIHSQDSPLNFLRMDQGSAVDQPSLLQVLNFHKNFTSFAAVLGSPVTHSQTPRFHQNYFENRGANVLGIDIKEKEWDQALPFLQSLGLKWAAVTSPLKKKASQWLEHREPAINTLFFDGKTWRGANTDPEGLKALVPKEVSGPIAVWGGGGTLSSIEAQKQEVYYYSSRTGEQKGKALPSPPKTLIWAVGRSHFSKQGVFPPKEWPLENIFDLNYSQDSPGIEAAHRHTCNYHSGLAMFKAQALAQQEFWDECQL